MLVGLAMVGRWMVVLLEGLGVLVEVDMLELVVELEGEPNNTAVTSWQVSFIYFVRLTFP